METENLYGLGYFLDGSYHILCREDKQSRFHVVTPLNTLEPEQMDYNDARRFIETHPVCNNISNHEIRIMYHSEIVDILQGRSPVSSVKSLALSGEEEDEEPLH